MGIFKKTFRMIFKKNNGSEKKHNNTLEEDIHLASDWVVKALIWLQGRLFFRKHERNRQIF